MKIKKSKIKTIIEEKELLFKFFEKERTNKLDILFNSKDKEYLATTKFYYLDNEKRFYIKYENRKTKQEISRKYEINHFMKNLYNIRTISENENSDYINIPPTYSILTIIYDYIIKYKLLNKII